MAERSAQESVRPSLTPETIVESATELIEREGLASFTMRSLGRELGVSAMAVYGHFPSRDALLCAVQERFMGTLDTDPVPGERWDDTLRRTMTSIYREELAHPEVASIEVSPQVAASGLAAHTEKIVRLYLAQGMPEPMLRQAWAMVDAYLTGFAGNAIALRAEAARKGVSVVELRRGEEGGAVGKAGASAAVPLWQRIVAEAYTDEAFADGVEIIIQGIRALAAPDPCAWRTPEA